MTPLTHGDNVQPLRGDRGQLHEEVLGDGGGEGEVNQEVGDSLDKLPLAHEGLQHAEDGRALAVRDGVEHAVDLKQEFLYANCHVAKFR